MTVGVGGEAKPHELGNAPFETRESLTSALVLKRSCSCAR